MCVCVCVCVWEQDLALNDLQDYKIQPNQTKSN